MPTTPQAVIAFYVANKLGVVPAFIHPLSTPPEIAHYLDATGAEFVLTLDAFYPAVVAATSVRALRGVVLARIGDYLSQRRLDRFQQVQRAVLGAHPHLITWARRRGGILAR